MGADNKYFCSVTLHADTYEEVLLQLIEHIKRLRSEGYMPPASIDMRQEFRSVRASFTAQRRT